MFVAGTSSLVKPQVGGYRRKDSRKPQKYLSYGIKKLKKCSRSVYIVQGRFFYIVYENTKKAVQSFHSDTALLISLLFFSIKSTFPIMGIYHSHRLQKKRIYYHASHELHSTLFKSAEILSDHSLVVLSHSYNISPSVNLQR